ncbi:hypothetical protein MCAV_03710 [[Mycoplasma] cavipharyngis]|uniref:hypothetical protein n=1 Tax=[Mycoplasma] cavipharyngis TaxID=92757 RepID=UPI00370418BA
MWSKYIPIIFFVVLTLAGLIWGYFSSWKKVVYYGVFNLTLFIFFIAFLPLISVNLVELLNPSLIFNAKKGSLVDSAFDIKSFNQVSSFLKQFYFVLVYFLSFVVLNIVLIILHLIFFRKALRRKKLEKIEKRWYDRVLTALLQSVLLLPLSFSLTGSITRLNQNTSLNQKTFFKKNNQKEHKLVSLSSLLNDQSQVQNHHDLEQNIKYFLVVNSFTNNNNLF